MVKQDPGKVSGISSFQVEYLVCPDNTEVLKLKWH